MPDPTASATIAFTVDGSQVEVPDDGASLLEALRDRLGRRGPKDGCSPQGQCGCCTVLVDGAARVACVTPVRRIAGRSVTTVDGLAPEVVEDWSQALCATGGSQCGFCTPGIVVRLAALREKGGDPTDHARRPGPAGAPLPLHGVADRGGGLGPAGRAGGAPRPRCRLGSGRDRGPRAAAGGSRGRARSGRVRRRHRTARRAGGGAGRRRRVGRGRDPHRGPAPGRQGPGPPHHRTRRPTARAPGWRVGRHAAHVVGRAGLPRDRRHVVRTGWRAGHRARQRRGLRRQGRQPARGRGPAPGRRARPAGPGAVVTRGRGAPRPQAAAGGRRRPG
ncbi:2Fe-2S iron-sulfur cluster binding domain-containing protein [Aquihabitans sp. G128]|nr:2Fe-2S iron-sulfur cluster binding domain-containing protein [Aquihabitans sp. G128]